jgi:DGQHR domain-containing protein
MRRGSSNRQLDPTNPIDAIVGAFELGKYRIPYLSTVLSAQQCKDYLSLARDDPEFTLANGRVEELFQRDLDEARVADMTRHYLNPDAAKRPVFFNSITVALLVNSHADFPAPAKIEQDPNEFSRAFGPIRVSWERSGSDGLPELGSFGCVYWNKHAVHAVAIDGQHRLEALKRLASRGGGGQRITVSVLFVLLDPQFGVKADETKPVELMRQLFIDLNKHAQKVSRSRELLLDDLEPVAIALRSTIGSQLNYEPVSGGQSLAVGQGREFHSCIPLALVDWHGDQKAKVDAGPYATSILALEWAIRCLCASKRFGKEVELAPSAFYSSDDDADEAAYYTRIEKKISAWFDEVNGLADSLNEARRTQRTFSLSSSEVKRMGELIHEQWGEALTWLLTRSGPYRRLAEQRASDVTLSAKFGTWYQARHAFESAKPIAKSALKAKLEAIETGIDEASGSALRGGFAECISKIDSQIKSVSISKQTIEPHLLFFLTGQRSLVSALRLMFDVGIEREASAGAVATELGWDIPGSNAGDAATMAKVIAEAVSCWDKLDNGRVFTKAARCKPCGRFNSLFWWGSILKRDGKNDVEFSAIASERGARVIYLMTAAWLFSKTSRSNPTSLVRKWCKSRRISDLHELDATAAGRHLKRALVLSAGFDKFSEAGHEANKPPFCFQAKMRIPDSPPFSLEDLGELVQNRFEWIWRHLRGEG